MLDGTATLVLGPEDTREEQSLRAGDHVCFHAGSDVAHHVENRSEAPVRYLIFGERLSGDTVVYPDHQVMMVKAMDFATFTYRPFTAPSADAGAAESDGG